MEEAETKDKEEEEMRNESVKGRGMERLVVGSIKNTKPKPNLYIMLFYSNSVINF